MKDVQLLERISCDPSVMAGKPVIRGTRLTVEYICKRQIATTFRQRDERWYTGSDFEEGQALGRDLTGMWNCA